MQPTKNVGIKAREVRCTEFQSWLKTTSIPPIAWKPRRDRWRCLDRAVQKMLSLFKSCARLEQLFSARPISASGRTFAPAIPQVDGADVAAKQKILTPSIAIPVALAQARAQPQARTFALQRWARKQMALWFALHLRTDL